ncbi:hypothetical protein COV19_04725 [Candidatus Woesearchaeota archaeon CG10_big_fil_rev_8_21_14_0_10_44_13]|nr:MAG: hypothetical protein COV19_04725 [Candidatus Woesearchaeota archaeon CG10_big_fil_rev_8_21_14_0_10_44_13]
MSPQKQVNFNFGIEGNKSPPLKKSMTIEGNVLVVDGGIAHRINEDDEVAVSIDNEIYGAGDCTPGNKMPAIKYRIDTEGGNIFGNNPPDHVVLGGKKLKRYASGIENKACIHAPSEQNQERPQQESCSLTDAIETAVKESHNKEAYIEQIRVLIEAINHAHDEGHERGYKKARDEIGDLKKGFEKRLQDSENKAKTSSEELRKNIEEGRKIGRCVNWLIAAIYATAAEKLAYLNEELEKKKAQAKILHEMNNDYSNKIENYEKAVNQLKDDVSLAKREAQESKELAAENSRIAEDYKKDNERISLDKDVISADKKGLEEVMDEIVEQSKQINEARMELEKKYAELENTTEDKLIETKRKYEKDTEGLNTMIKEGKERMDNVYLWLRKLSGLGGKATTKEMAETIEDMVKERSGLLKRVESLENEVKQYMEHNNHIINGSRPADGPGASEYKGDSGEKVGEQETTPEGMYPINGQKVQCKAISEELANSARYVMFRLYMKDKCDINTALDEIGKIAHEFAMIDPADFGLSDKDVGILSKYFLLSCDIASKEQSVDTGIFVGNFLDKVKPFLEGIGQLDGVSRMNNVTKLKEAYEAYALKEDAQ